MQLKIVLVLLFLVYQFVYGENDEQSEEQMSFIGLAVEAFNPCPDSFIFMEREIGRKPSEENYWTGIVDLERYEHLKKRVIHINLDNEANITMKSDMGLAAARGKYLCIFPNAGKSNIRFDVKAKQGKPFPNIVSIHINRMKICENPPKWEPAILGTQSTAGNL